MMISNYSEKRKKAEDNTQKPGETGMFLSDFRLTALLCGLAAVFLCGACLINGMLDGFSESEGAGRIASILRTAVGNNAAAASFFGFADDEETVPAAVQAAGITAAVSPDEAVISCFPEYDAAGYIEEHNAAGEAPLYVGVIPVNGTLTSGFSFRRNPFYTDEECGESEYEFHSGVDIAANTGTKIAAYDSGEVLETGESPEYGKYVILAHEQEITTLYAHCLTVTVSEGEHVEAGQMIALVGSTGRATGPHLHFEIRAGGLAEDPGDYLDVYKG